MVRKELMVRMQLEIAVECVLTLDVVVQCALLSGIEGAFVAGLVHGFFVFVHKGNHDFIYIVLEAIGRGLLTGFIVGAFFLPRLFKEKE